MSEPGSIWGDAPLELYLSDQDFEREYGRERNADEQAAHDLFSLAAALSEPRTQLSVGPEIEGGEPLT